MAAPPPLTLKALRDAIGGGDLAVVLRCIQECPELLNQRLPDWGSTAVDAAVGVLRQAS